MWEDALAVPNRETWQTEYDYWSSYWGLDPLVVETVAGLRARGLPTHMSCHGHIEYGTLWPWVMLDPEASRPTELHEICHTLHRTAYSVFPQDEVAIWPFLLRPSGPIQFAPLCATPAGGAVAWWREITSLEGQERLLRRCQVEMVAFGRFLVDGRPVREHREAAEKVVEAAWADGPPPNGPQAARLLRRA